MRYRGVTFQMLDRLCREYRRISPVCIKPQTRIINRCTELNGGARDMYRMVLTEATEEPMIESCFDCGIGTGLQLAYRMQYDDYAEWGYPVGSSVLLKGRQFGTDFFLGDELCLYQYVVDEHETSLPTPHSIYVLGRPYGGPPFRWEAGLGKSGGVVAPPIYDGIINCGKWFVGAPCPSEPLGPYSLWQCRETDPVPCYTGICAATANSALVTPMGPADLRKKIDFPPGATLCPDPGGGPPGVQTWWDRYLVDITRADNGWRSIYCLWYSTTYNWWSVYDGIWALPWYDGGRSWSTAVTLMFYDDVVPEPDKLVPPCSWMVLVMANLLGGAAYVLNPEWPAPPAGGHDPRVTNPAGLYRCVSTTGWMSPPPWTPWDPSSYFPETLTVLETEGP